MRQLLTALLFLASTANAYDVKRDSSGEVANWKTPLHFIVDDQLDSKLHVPGSTEAVNAALKTVNAAVPSLDLKGTPGKTQGMGYDFDHPEKSTSDIIVPEEWKWNVDAVATTIVTITRSSHQIIEADIAFNIQNTKFAIIVGDGLATGYDVQNAMTHEIGHAIGLAHTDVPNTVMFPTSGPGDISKRELAADDLAGLKFLYAKPVTVPTAEEKLRGCSATGSAPFALLAMMMVVLMRRRRMFVALAAVLGAFVFVAPVFAAGSPTERAWTVSNVVTQAPVKGTTLLESEITFMRDGELQTMRVLGGRWGDIEQIVDGASVPQVGQAFRLEAGR